jgi:hypothetical protein
VIVWVLDGNRARGFYEHLGGRQVGRRTVQLDDDVFAAEIACGWTEMPGPDR